MLSTKGIVPFISISRPPHLFLWRSCRTTSHPDVLSGNVDTAAVEESQQFCDFAADSVRVPLHQS